MVSTKTESEISLMSYAGKVCYELLELMEKAKFLNISKEEVNKIVNEFYETRGEKND